MKLKCCVCGREREENTMKVFSPTQEEKDSLKKMGEKNLLERYAYCRPCVRILSEPKTAVALMSGVLQFQARAIGVSSASAEAIAERFGSKALKLTKKT